MATMFDADALPEVLTIEEAADLLRISRNSAHALAKLWRDSGGREGLPVIELGRNLRVPRVGVQRLLHGGRKGTSDEGPNHPTSARPWAVGAGGTAGESYAGLVWGRIFRVC